MITLSILNLTEQYIPKMKRLFYIFLLSLQFEKAETINKSFANQKSF